MRILGLAHQKHLIIQFQMFLYLFRPSRMYPEIFQKTEKKKGIPLKIPAHQILSVLTRKKELMSLQFLKRRQIMFTPEKMMNLLAVSTMTLIMIILMPRLLNRAAPRLHVDIRNLTQTPKLIV